MMEESASGIQELSSTSLVMPPRPDSTVSSYLTYPAMAPFINSDYTRAADAPLNAYPTSDRDAVISALKNLHEKVKKLELERNIAEENLKSLASETEQYKELLKIEKHRERSCSHQELQTDDVFTLHTQELEGQISSAEHRCQLLEKQLQQMKQMVNKSEQSRRQLMEQMRKLQQNNMTETDIRRHMERLGELERDQRRLILTQTLAESKVKVLEQMLKEEQMHREVLQERMAQLESAAQGKHTPSSPSPHEDKEAPVIQVWRMSKSSKKKSNTCRSHPMRHYRLNLADIPFVAGKSTGPSHSLGANVQNVLALLKLHNPVLCSHVCTEADLQRVDSTSSGSSVGSGDIRSVLSELLNQLQDEFGQLSSQHHEVMSQMHAARDAHSREQLEQELDMLLTNMKMKTQQITRIRQHQNKMQATTQVHQSSARCPRSKHAHSATRMPQHDADIKGRTSRSQVRSRSKNTIAPENAALSVLRDVKKIQRTLRKDDLHWE